VWHDVSCRYALVLKEATLIVSCYLPAGKSVFRLRTRPVRNQNTDKNVKSLNQPVPHELILTFLPCMQRLGDRLIHGPIFAIFGMEERIFMLNLANFGLNLEFKGQKPQNLSLPCITSLPRRDVPLVRFPWNIQQFNWLSFLASV